MTDAKKRIEYDGKDDGSQPNIVDYYIINCAILSIITIENCYQITDLLPNVDLGNPRCCAFSPSTSVVYNCN